MPSAIAKVKSVCYAKTHTCAIPTLVGKRFPKKQLKRLGKIYVTFRSNEGRTTSCRDETLVMETIDFPKPMLDKDQNPTQCIVTMDGFKPNSFKSDTSSNKEDKKTPAKKQKTPIVFDVEKKDKETESASSDNDMIVTTTTKTHKYDALPPYSLDTMIRMSTWTATKNDQVYIKPTATSFTKLMRLAGENPQRLPLRVSDRVSVAERMPVWCRAFPMCRYGNSCAFQHPRCKYAAACTRRGCFYSHGPTPLSSRPFLSSHVAPAANYKSISASTLPITCKYYPSCSNPVCTFFHPKACRYGAACLNKLECNFYHADLTASKWRYPA